MKVINMAIALMCAISLFSQQKGVSPFEGGKGGESSSTYAVVVGISDYQDEDIPDLKYAHKDAEAFANFLRSPAGGALNGDHLKLLVNEKATTAQLVSSLDWLIENCGESDRAIIYFSGHGDTEAKLRNNLGFLLTWDSPARAYMAGAYPIYYLQNVIETISLEKKAKVLLITDACRSGKLAGSNIGGNALTSANLAKLYANEVKILSCQPDEYSIEGEQWGDGRGAFSYHLVEGLYGLADSNNDQSVSLLEIGRYLEDHVPKEVAPQSQLPMTVGNGRENLAAVFADILAQAQKSKAGQMPKFSPTDSRGIEDEVLAAVDTTILEWYAAFEEALKNKVFFEPADACADAYYERLISEPKLERLHNTMRRNYAAALQDDAQQVLLNWLKNDSREIRELALDNIKKYSVFPKQLRRAASLLGTEHYMYNTLQARVHFFNACINWTNETSKEEVLNDYRKSLDWQPDAPYTHLFKGLFHAYALDQRDTAFQEILLASSLAPTWIYPYTALADLYISQSEYHKADSILAVAWQIDSSSAKLFKALGDFEFYKKNYLLAEPWYLKAIELNPLTDVGSYMDLGNVYLFLGRVEDAVSSYKQAIVLDKDTVYIGLFYNLALAYQLLKEFDKIEELYKSMVAWYPFETRWAERNTSNTYFDMSRLSANQGNSDISFGYLEKALSTEILPEYYNLLMECKDFKNLRAETDSWNNLMKKYFPDQFKY